MTTGNTESEFWSQVVRSGLPRFRFLRQPLSISDIELNVCDHPDWSMFRSKIENTDEIWPFMYPRKKRYWGKKQGYVALRGRDFVAGIVTTVE